MSRAALKSIQAAASSGGVADTGDEYFGNTVLLLDGDGTDGGANSLFSDSSNSNLTMSETGTVTQGSFSPYLNNWSNYFGNADSNVTFTPSFTMGTNDFCIEFWANFTETPASSIVTFFTLSVNTGDYLRFELNNAGQGFTFRIRKNNANDVLLSQYTDGSDYDTPSVWTHFAVTRSSNTFRFFVDGVLRDSTTFSGSLSSFTLGSIGCWTQIAQDFKGYISNLRITNGSIPSSRQTSSTTSGDEIFTPPTSNLSAITDTVLLTCQSNHFVDNSSSPHTFSVNGNPRITTFSPTKDSDAIDITTDGGSAFFDNTGSGNNNYLQSTTASLVLGTSSFTMEAWVYPTEGTSGYPAFFCTQGGGTSTAFPNIAFGGSTGQYGYFKYYSGNTTNPITSSTTFPRYAWYHVALVWDGETNTLYVNGNSVGTSTNVYDYSTALPRYRIGGWDYTGGSDFPGYVTNAKLTLGPAYTAEFDAPTAPLSKSLGTAWDISTGSHIQDFYVGSQAPNVSDLAFNSGGTKLYVLDDYNDKVFQYTLSTAWDVSTASYDSVSFNTFIQPRCFVFANSGEKLYITRYYQNIATIYQYSLTTNYDISTASYDNKSFDTASTTTGYTTGFDMSSDGSKIYVVSNPDDAIYEFDLTTNYDISTAEYNNVSLDVSGTDTIPLGVRFKPDGTKMYLMGSLNDTLFEYNLTTAWDLSSASLSGNTFYWGNENTNISGIFFKSDGTKFYTTGNSTDDIHEYNVTQSADILLNFQDSDIYDRTGTCNIDTIYQASIDTSVKKYGLGSIQMDGAGDYLDVKPATADILDFPGDFTIEFWLYTTTTDTQYMFDSRLSGNSTGWSAFLLSNTMYFNMNGTLYTSGTLSNYTNTWIHVAYVRSGSAGRWYIDGTASGSAHNLGTSTIVANGDKVRIGAGASVSTETAGSILNGYMDDFRITNGIARYTSNFTPSSEALPKF